MKTYLGDSVYAEFDGYYIILTTENGNGPSNTIMLEPPVLTKLRDYVTEIYELARQSLQDSGEVETLKANLENE